MRLLWRASKELRSIESRGYCRKNDGLWEVMDGRENVEDGEKGEEEEFDD